MDQPEVIKQQPIPVNTTITKWFTEEEFYWRSLAGYIWVIFIFPIIFLAFVLSVNLSILSPLTWITDSLSIMFSLSTISSIALLQIGCLLATIPNARSLAVQKKPSASSAKFVIFLLLPNQLVCMLCFIGFSFLTSSVLKQYCASNTESSLFLTLLSVYVGLIYTVAFYKKHLYVVEFPVIQQTRFFRFKKVFLFCLHDALITTLKTLQYYYLLYVMIALVPSSILPEALAVHNDLTIINAISIIFDVALLWDSFCVSLVILFLLYISNVLLKIFNTQVYRFPITAAAPEDESKTLADALETSDPFLKNLGYLDFNILSKYQTNRRQDVFDLSPPGNQPHCWNRACAECLKIIKEMRCNLASEAGKKQELKIVSKPVLPNTVGEHGLFSASEESVKTASQNTSWLASPGKLFSKLTSPRTAESPLCPPKRNVTVPIAVKASSGKPINVFENIQIVLWCVEGLCNLAAISVKEDKYGVVQKKLPGIVEELLLLLEACELFRKKLFNVPSSNHSQHVEAAQMNTTHATTLKLAVKTGLYMLATSFGYHINSIRLPVEHKKRLHAFLEFAE